MHFIPQRNRKLLRRMVGSSIKNSQRSLLLVSKVFGILRTICNSFTGAQMTIAPPAPPRRLVAIPQRIPTACTQNRVCVSKTQMTHVLATVFNSFTGAQKTPCQVPIAIPRTHAKPCLCFKNTNDTCVGNCVPQLHGHSEPPGHRKDDPDSSRYNGTPGNSKHSECAIVSRNSIEQTAPQLHELRAPHHHGQPGPEATHDLSGTNPIRYLSSIDSTESSGNWISLNSPLAQACGDCATCDPHRRDSQCITLLTSGRCVQHAREDGRCVFHSQKLINMCETVLSLSYICTVLPDRACAVR
jgi:hypothetical protein